MAMKLARRLHLLQPSLFNKCARPSSLMTHGSLFNLQHASFSAGKTNHTYIVGLDGTDYGFNALRRALECSNGADRIVCVYFPASTERLEVELMIFGPNQATPEIKQLKKEMESMKDETIRTITGTANEIKNEYCTQHEGMDNIIFEIKVGDASPSAKHDIVRACYDFKADSLFLGAKGIAHTFKDKVEKTFKDHVGSVPDYCLHHAPCDVMVIKPAEY